MTLSPAPRGKLITFEGGEGTGKSTQVRLLAERLAAAGVDVVATREPGGSPHAEVLRNVLLSGFGARLGPEGEALLFTAARIDHLDATILPALAAGRFVISDRFIDSTLAYQGVLGDVNGELIAALERVAIGEHRPDLTILIDLAPDVGLARAAKRRGNEGADRFEGEGLAFHTRLREAYLAIARAEPTRFLVVDGDLPVDTLADRIWREVAGRFSLLAEAVA